MVAATGQASPFISVHTVRDHLKTMSGKMGVNRRLGRSTGPVHGAHLVTGGHQRRDQPPPDGPGRVRDQHGAGRP